jgi:hypothetical protein
MLYEFIDPEQTLIGPVTVPGLANVVIVPTASVLAALGPHPLFAVTDKVPPVLPVVVVMLLLVLVPVQPDGSDHV